MRILVVDSYYGAFIDQVYAANSGLASASYAEQKQALLDRYFGTSDFYSSNLKALGHDGTEIINTCLPLQNQWARERGLSPVSDRSAMRGSSRLPWILQFRGKRRAKILLEQVREFCADVVHFQDPIGTPKPVIDAIRSVAPLVTAQVASRVSKFADFNRFDLTLTSFPHYVKQFRRVGAKAEYFNLGFEPRVLSRLERQAGHDVVFVGGLSPRHAARTEWLEAVARAVPLKWWGYGVENLSAGSPLRKMHQGEAWGIDMYNIFFNSRIVLNHHIDEAEDNANNMRLYEATGTGALLLTDAKTNLSDLFDPGEEVVTYANAKECAAQIEYFLEHEDERAVIAKAGQERTLRDHTYRQRMEQMVRLLSPLVGS